MKPNILFKFRLLSLLALSFHAPLNSFAASGTWTDITVGPNNWSNTAMWLGGTVADAATFTASFTSNITGTTTVTLDTNRTIGNLTFSDNGASGSAWTLANSGGSVLTLDNSTSQAVITKTTTATISALLAGSNIKIAGNASLTLSGNNTGITGNVEFTGINGVNLSNANALGTASIKFSASEVFGGTTTGITIANNITFNGGVQWWSGGNGLKTTGSVTLSAANQGYNNFGSSTTTEWAGNTVLAANALNIAGGGSGGLTLSGVVSGTGGKIVKSGANVLSLTGTGANTFTGGVDFSAGSIRVGNNNAALGTGTLTVTTPTLNASSTNLLATAQGGGARTLANNVVITNNGTGITTLQLDGGWADLSLSGNISGTGGISTASSGKVSLTGTNTYTGSTVLSGSNTLVLSGSNTTSGITVGSGTTLALRTISLSSTQNITGAGNVTKDISTFGSSSIAGTNNNYTGTTNVNIDKFTLGSGGVINGTSSITVQGQWSARFENLGTTTTPGGVTAGGYAGSGTDTEAGIFYNGNSAGTTPGTLNAASITLSNSFRSDAASKAKGGEFFNYANSSVSLSSGAITVNGQGNALAGGMVAAGSTFNNAGSVTAGSITLNSSSTANTASNKGGTYSQTGGSTTLSGTATLAANGGTGAAGTAGNDAAFNLSGGTFSAGTLAVNSGTVTATGGNLNLGAGGITSTGANTIAVNLGATTFGATANWTSSVPMTLSNSTTGTTFATAGGNIGLSGALSGIGKLVKTNSGTLTLTGSNTYTGLTTVSAGTLALSGAGSLSDSTKVDIATSSVFDISGITSSSETIGSLVSASGSSISLGAKVLDIGSDGTDFSSEGNISGPGGGIKKSGNGILTLKGNNTYTGTTDISQGTLLLGANNALPTGSALSLSGATTFKSGGFSTTTGPLSVSGGVDIDLGAGATSIVTFSNIGTWSGILNIWNYSGGAVGAGSTGDKLIFNAQSGTFNLANVQFYTGNIGDTGSQLGSGAGFIGNELVPIPEPSTALVAFVLLGFVCLRERRANGR